MGKTFPQECRTRSLGAKEAVSVTEGIKSKPKAHSSITSFLGLVVSIPLSQ